MSVLAVLIPPRVRLTARSAKAEPPSAAAAPLAQVPGAWSYALIADGLAPSSQGQAATALLPRADTVVAVLSPADVGWQRVTLPRAPAGKMRSALEGLLEEQLLDDPEALHFALAPQATPGQSTWVAVVHKGWLSATLAALERAGLTVDRVVPTLSPSETPQGHFFDTATGPEATGHPTLCLADAEGVSCVALSGSLARASLPTPTQLRPRWTATPAVATQAERWLAEPVTIQTEAERALQATRSLWNLRQFDLAPRHRGARALKEGFKRLRSPAWRPARLGLATLAVVQVIGLNAWAWAQKETLDARRAAQAALLRTAHPQVRAVLDAPLQMQRETEQLRAAAGRPGDGDLEVLMSAAASAWPEGQGPAQALRFEPGRLSLTVPGWGEGQIRQFRDRLRPAGWSLESEPGRVTIARAPATPRKS